jgi:hypothetical protein
MLRYYLVAMLLVVGSLVVAAHFSRPAKPIETASVQSSGTPSAPRAQATFTVPPRGVHGEAPWALSALPECFEQEAEAHGPLAFVRAHLPAGMHAVIAPSVLDAADCRVRVLPRTGVVERGTERLVIPPKATFFTDGRRFALIRQTGTTAELRVYHLFGNGQVTFVSTNER